MTAVSRRAFLGQATILGLGLAAVGCSPSPETVVVYTSLDQPLSEPILKEFESATGVRVKAVYDAEAAKTTGLVSRLVAERERPQADVFWSSEYAQTLKLATDGLFKPYDSPAAQDIPATYRDPKHLWIGFAARTRVFIINTSLVSPNLYPRSIFDLLDERWAPGDVIIANPLFGTTATHAAALYAALGPERTQEYFVSLRERGARIVDGNSVVRDMVVSGEAKVGLTDTDDAQDAVAKGAKVAVVIPDQEGADALGTLIIPNTVGLVRGAPHPVQAKRFVDYLVGPEVESRLARSASVQMPVRASVAVPAGVTKLESLRPMSPSLAAVAEQYPHSSTWLRETFLR